MSIKCLILLAFIAILMSKSVVLSLGEYEDFDELLSMVIGNMSAAQRYVIPQDNLNLLNLTNPSVLDFGTYDFIIIGAGSTGSVLANRLSEISDWRILLLEAGGEDNDFTKILALNSYLFYSDFNWGYNTTPQRNACLGVQNRTCFLPQGRAIGGCTTINGGIYARGVPEDYDRWANVYGNPGWSYTDVLPYFIKSENAVFYPRDIPYHGVDGYLTVNQTNETPGLEQVLIRGFQEQGLDEIDLNGRFQLGITKTQYALRGNERVSTATAFLDNIKNRQNLKVSLNSFVTSLLINKNKAVCGVGFVKNGQMYVAKASKEVIVSAGAINSVQLLLLSGIGPRKHLRDLGIPVKMDLPVGRNFQDHLMFVGFYFRAKSLLYHTAIQETLKLYVEYKRPLTDGIYAEMLGFTNFPLDHGRRPEIEYMFSIPGTASDVAQMEFMLTDEYTAAYRTNPSTDFMVIVILLHPKSRGTITLRSNSPVDKPIINPNFLSEPEDIETVYNGIQFLLALNNSQAFQESGLEAVIFDYPNCRYYEKLSKDWWLCAIPYLSSTEYHPAAANRMGPDPRTSVVDPNLKVHGVKKLRVADSSIIPELTSGHLMAPTIMIGEKLSDMIKQEYGKIY